MSHYGATKSPDCTRSHTGKACPHPACTELRHRYAKKWRVERARGLKRRMDADTVREHITALIAQGWSQRAIAGEAGVPVAVVNRTLHADRASISRIAAAAILALDPTTLPSRSDGSTDPFVPKRGAVRRIQALLAMGYSHAEQQRLSGVRTACVMHQRGTWINRSTHDAVAAMYDAHSHILGPSEVTRDRARKAGHPGPLAWDDIDRDEQPVTKAPRSDDLDDVAIQRRMDGDRTIRLTKAEKVELVRRWRASGRPVNECARVTGLNVNRYYDTADETDTEREAS